MTSSIKLSKDRIAALHAPRIVMQRITGVDSAIRIIAALAPSDTYCANSTNYISPVKNSINLKYLIGVLNSSCINFFFKQTSTNTNVTSKEIAKFPIPIPTNQIQESIIKLVDLIPDSKEPFNYEFNIDLIVYKVFELSYEQVLRIDLDFQNSMTKEEYDNFTI